MNKKARPIVLSADDDDDAHVLLTRAFIKAGVKASLTHVYDGSDVIRYLLGEGEYSDREMYPLPNLLLLDLKMRRVSGFEVMEWIRQHPHLQAIPSVVFSSSDNEKDVSRAYALGCHSYVVKPADFEKLVQMVLALEMEFLQKNGSEQSQGAPAFATFAIPPKAVKVDSHPKNMNASTAVNETPEMFKLLVDQVKDYAIFLLDKEGRILSWNEGARRIKGYEPHEIIGQHFSTFYSAKDKENEKPAFELRMAQDMGRYEEEGWRVRKDGSRFWANVTITPLRDATGKLSGFAKVTRDLTQRKFQEENTQRLLESEERFRMLVEQVKDYAIFILDAKGNVTTWNQGAKRIKGYNSDEIIGRHFSVFYTPDALAQDHPAKELSIAIREGRYEEEGWRLRKDGSRFWANVVITALWDKRGNLTGFAKVTRDLSQRKREEEALRHKTEELESFAHTLSHDLRAPLRSISSFAHILKNDGEELSEKQREDYLNKIVRAAQSMEVLTGDMLKLSLVSLAPVAEEMVPLCEVVEQSLGLLEGEIRKTQAQIEIQQPMPTVYGDRTLLMQIFSNLLTNALKFVPSGKTPKVEVYAIQKKGICEIHVKDRGIGIPEQHQESIFNLFERGGHKEFSGSGVGLAIVKKAAERIGGAISVKSKTGEGSDFIVTLHCEVFAPVEMAESL